LRGFSLVEILITVLLFTLVFMATFAVLTAGKNSWYVGDVEVEINQEMRKGLLVMNRQLRQSRSSVITGVLPNGSYYSSITFKVPEDTDNDGDVIDALGNMEWSNDITYSLNASNQIIRTFSGNTTILANSISNLQFRRPAGNPDVVQIYLTAQKATVLGRTLTSDIMSSIRMRN
jgi:hypothetical protein